MRPSLATIAKAKKPTGSFPCFSPKAAARSLPVQVADAVRAPAEVAALADIEPLDSGK